MAVSPVGAGGEDGWKYGGGITMFVALSCVTAAMGVAIFGYDVETSGGVSSMRSFLEEFFPDVCPRMEGDVRVSNYCKFDSQLLTLFTSSLYITGLLTAMLLSSCGGAVNVYMAILGRALLGVGLGFANQAVLLYLYEMAPARYSGAFSNGFQLSLCLGPLAANIINYGAEKITSGWCWRLSLGLAGVPAALFTLGAVFLPETPNSLVQQGEDRGKGSGGGENGLRLMLSQPRYRPQLALAVALLMPAFTQLNGINAISVALLSTVNTVVIYTASTVVFMFVIDRFGRRALLIAGSLQMLASEVLIGALMAAELGDEGGMGRGYAVVLFVLIGVYVAGYSWSWGPMTWFVPTEVFPLEVRAAGQSVTVASGFVFTIFIAQGFLAMLCRMRAWLFFFFAGWIVVMTGFVYWFLPETKGMPIEEVGEVWSEHWFWGRVVG
ncbi:hypothetical protein BS78_05G190300, partial [Paspalum vaginatum]